jgi:hypothetical protein
MTQDWAQGSDRDYQIAGRRGRDYYRVADTWLRSAVEAGRVEQSDPAQAARLRLAARQARDALASFAAQ